MRLTSSENVRKVSYMNMAIEWVNYACKALKRLSHCTGNAKTRKRKHLTVKYILKGK